jgi:hypothetical protein
MASKPRWILAFISGSLELIHPRAEDRTAELGRYVDAAIASTIRGDLVRPASIM